MTGVQAAVLGVFGKCCDQNLPKEDISTARRSCGRPRGCRHCHNVEKS